MLKSFFMRIIAFLFGGSKSIYYVGGSDSLPQALTPEEEAALLETFRQSPDTVRKTLIERNLRLVVYIARKFENTGVSLEDLTSIGTIGLIKSIQTYDPDRKIKLATYASRCIENEILMYLRRTVNQKREVSLDEPLGADSDGNELLLSDILGTEPDEVTRPVEEAEDLRLLREALGRLTKKERLIMTLRFGLGGREPQTQKEVADRLGISQSYVSRLEKQTRSRLLPLLGRESFAKRA